MLRGAPDVTSQRMLLLSRLPPRLHSQVAWPGQLAAFICSLIEAKASRQRLKQTMEPITQLKCMTRSRVWVCVSMCARTHAYNMGPSQRQRQRQRPYPKPSQAVATVATNSYAASCHLPLASCCLISLALWHRSLWPRCLAWGGRWLTRTHQKARPTHAQLPDNVGP